MSDEQPPGATRAADTGAIDQAQRPAPERRRTFWSILANTALANLTTSYLWFALTFWIYLETRNVIATGVIGGSYMLALSMTSISFGTFVDRFRKLRVMQFAGGFTLVMFVVAGAVFWAIPNDWVADMGRPWLWIFASLVLVGAVVENMRNIALSTTVTILVEADERDKANGVVGMVQGLAFMVTSVLSGLSVGFLGMGATIIIAVTLTVVSFLHLLTVAMPEEREPAASDATGNFDLAGSWRSVRAIPGLIALIAFSMFNNLIGGTYMALMDPYGLELFSVQVWGLLFALASTGFLVGGAIIGKVGLGRNPLRTMLLAVAVMGLLGAMFTIREWGWLYLVGIWLYMAIFPAVEAAEQTVIQRVVPLERQGRVFGFAGAVEAAAAPVTAFLVAPIAEFWIIPWARSTSGADALAPLLGRGTARGIALIFLVAGLVMVAAALLAMLGPVYRVLSRAYTDQVERDTSASAEDATGETGPGLIADPRAGEPPRS